MTHYQTLSLPQNATLPEIKSAYRRLCLETHPDLHSCTLKAERFKRINAAYAVLSDVAQRRRYDSELKESTFRWRNSSSAKSRASSRASTSTVAGFGYSLPRNVFIGSLLGIAAATIYNTSIREEGSKSTRIGTLDDDKEHVGKSKLVEAYYNPKSRRYEKPKPWDEEYRRLNPKIVLVERREVFDTR